MKKSTQVGGWGGAEGKSEIAAIFNKYKDTLDNFIDSSDIKSPNWLDSPDRLRLIDKGSRNTPRFRGGSPTLLKENRLDKDILVTLLELAPKIRTSQVYQHHDIASLSLKSGRAQYKNS